MKSIRTLHVYGTVVANTVTTVTVDGKIVHNGAYGVRGYTELFSFSTPTNVHGKVTVSIEVLSGQVEIEQVTVTYPAVINEVDAFVTFVQPIAQPMVIQTGNRVSPINYTIKERTRIVYDHLMFRGPAAFIVTALSDVVPGADLYIGNLLTNKFAPNIQEIQNFQKSGKQVNIHSTWELLKLYNKVYHIPMIKLVWEHIKSLY